MTALRLAACLTLLAGAAAAAAAYEPPSFVARYDVHHSGAKVAETTLSVHEDDEAGIWEIRSVTEPRGLAALIRFGDVVEVSRFVVDGDTLVPRAYRFDDGTRKGRRNSAIEFDWAIGSALSRYKGVDAALPIDGGEMDRLLLQLAVMRDLARERLPASYALIDRNERKRYEFTLIGRERIKTPAGRFDTVKVRRQRPGSTRATIVWASRDHDFLPVKMVQLKDDRPNAVLTLVRLDRPAP